MRLTVLLAAAVLIAIGLLVQTVIKPEALNQNGKPSTADLSHPPTEFGAATPVAAPHDARK